MSRYPARAFSHLLVEKKKVHDNTLGLFIELFTCGCGSYLLVVTRKKSRPIQTFKLSDFLTNGGLCDVTERGCFCKTFCFDQVTEKLQRFYFHEVSMY
jgi:hypothetical protein